MREEDDGELGMEPYCVTCSGRAGIFLFRSRDWLHYRADAVGNAGPYEAGHEPLIGEAGARTMAFRNRRRMTSGRQEEAVPALDRRRSRRSATRIGFPGDGFR